MLIKHIILCRIQMLEQSIKIIRTKVDIMCQMAFGYNKDIYEKAGIPTNVIYTPGEKYEYQCPLCGFDLSDYDPKLDNFCQRCGQRIQFMIQPIAWELHPLKDEFDNY